MTRYVLNTRYVADATRIHIISSFLTGVLDGSKKNISILRSKNIEQTGVCISTNISGSYMFNVFIDSAKLRKRQTRAVCLF